MNKDPLNFGVSGIFGRMGQNPSINALTNANAIASQQPAMGNSMMAKPDMSQQIMTGSFDPLTQQVGMGIFGDQNARNMAVRGSGIMMSPMLKALGSEPNVDPCSAEFDYEIATDAGHSAEDIKKYREANCKSGSPAKNTEEKPHGTYGDQGYIKSYKKGNKYVAIDKSEHDSYEDERVASGQALTKAKKKAREARRNK